MASFDVVIIGSGAGGAPIAHSSSRAGKQVLVLEKGPLLRPQYQTPTGSQRLQARRDVRHRAGEAHQVPGVANTGATFYSSHVEPDLNDEPHVYREPTAATTATIEGYTAQVVGGGTQLYGGVSLRFTPRRLPARDLQRAAAPTCGTTRTATCSARRATGRSATTISSRTTAEAEQLVGINGTRDSQLKPASQATTTSRRWTPNPISQLRRSRHGRARACRGTARRWP